MFDVSTETVEMMEQFVKDNEYVADEYKTVMFGCMDCSNYCAENCSNNCHKSADKK